jgi:hypothetical protein
MSILRVSWPDTLGRVEISAETARDWNDRRNAEDPQLARAVENAKHDATALQAAVIRATLRGEDIDASDLVVLLGGDEEQCAELIHSMSPNGFVQCVAMPQERIPDEEKTRRMHECDLRLRGTRVGQLRLALARVIGRKQFSRRDRRDAFISVALEGLCGDFSGDNRDVIAQRLSRSGVGLDQCEHCLD